MAIGRTGARGEAPPVGLRSRAKISDEIISNLRSKIADGTYRRGHKLPTERELADHYGVSQPTIREAMRALDAMGLVEVRQGSGAYVRTDVGQYVSVALNTLVQMESVGLLDALEIREVLGHYSARRAVRYATTEDIEAIEEAAYLCGRTPERGTAAATVPEAITNFQLAVSRASHNPLLHEVESYLIRLLMSLQISAKSRDAASYWEQRATDFQEDRLRIARLLRARDGDATVAALVRYIEDQRTMFTADPDLRTVRLDSFPL